MAWLNPDPTELKLWRVRLKNFVCREFEGFSHHRDFAEPSDYGTDYGDDYFSEFVDDHDAGRSILVQLIKTEDGDVQFFVSKPDDPSVWEEFRTFPYDPQTLREMGDYIRVSMDRS